ncbi:MAG: tRNA (adenosine(37)-N6)-threonylcarbamoyltransferase complex ATPase subunit type 1 TsaE [Chitinophagaceae bacterium]|nr:tRNA (adenosine(37)-N6)-threonylcarbamoyltransferase complex ATPase subunit type 1 TsaE [Rubrivivax sp.]
MPSLHVPILGTPTPHRSSLWSDEAACGDFAVRLAGHAELRNAFIALHGPLGAGKTTFVRHLLRGLGVTGRIKSPTYAVLEPYDWPDEAGLVISHFDFYRFDDPREWAEAGFREIFAEPGLKLVEWPDKAAGMLPPADLELRIEPVEDQPDARRVTLTAASATGVALLQ